MSIKKSLPILSLSQALASANLFFIGAVVLFFMGPEDFLYFGFIGYLISILKCIFEGYISPLILKNDQISDPDRYQQFIFLSKTIIIAKFIVLFAVFFAWPDFKFLICIVVFLITVTLTEFTRTIIIAKNEIIQMLLLDLAIAIASLTIITILIINEKLSLETIILSLSFSYFVSLTVFRRRDIMSLFRNTRLYIKDIKPVIRGSDIGHQYLVRLVVQLLIYGLAMGMISSLDLALLRLSQLLTNILRIPLLGTRQYIYNVLSSKKELDLNIINTRVKVTLTVTILFIASIISIITVLVNRTLLESEINVYFIFVASFMFLLIPLISFAENTIAALIFKQTVDPIAHRNTIIISFFMIVTFVVTVEYIGVLVWPILLLAGSGMNATMLYGRMRNLSR